MTYLCVARPASGRSSVGHLVYCAMNEVPPAPGESGKFTIAEVRCGGKGLRGSLSAHMVYKHTIKAQTEDRVKDPAHAGEGFDVTATFDLIDRALP
jgi:hypothetical protein